MWKDFMYKSVQQYSEPLEKRLEQGTWAGKSSGALHKGCFS
jgi:hypothetical protein